MSANEIVWLLLLLMTAVFLVIGLAVDFRAAKITGGGYADSANPLTIALAHRKRGFSHWLSANH